MDQNSALSSDFYHFLAALGIILVIVGFAEFLKSILKMQSGVTRKIVHVGTSVLVALSPNYFETGFYPAVLAVLFIPFNLLAIKKGWLSSINKDEALEAHHQDQNYGTVYFPLSFLILTLLCWDSHAWIMQTAMLILGFGDAFASLVGENTEKPHAYKLLASTKSLEGSITMFGTSLIILVGAFVVFQDQSEVIKQMDLSVVIALCVAIALIVTAVEALLSGGLDNLFIPLSVAYLLAVLETNGIGAVQGILLGVSLSLILARASLAFKFLTPDGAVGTFLFGSNIFSMGGVEWTVPILTFFLLSSVLSKLGKSRKKKYDLIFEKSSQRDFGQVLANGGVGWILIIWYSFTNEPMLFIAYLGTLAAVQADTWATEVGTMMKDPKPRFILNMKPVPAGTSGGITFTGTMGGFFGALLICASAWAIMPDELMSVGLVQSFLIVGLAGAGGSLVDSFFGATVQAQYYDPIRKKETERTHSVAADGTIVENELIKGYRIIDNDIVNFLCATMGALFATFLTYFMVGQI
ncbi:protein of unknown function DUF92 transmembrane [Chloroherpeton thalassium ATCC 35110]|uniref:DUF92 domain-containing protein n=1 Tax=Chloroherpeton thalassium (strain ATCC 35110 / GB-78) TaxID=517418 RepID=B3QTE2_CHLT3|nr:DUF92 domain-containing protein [Chloroherpeton thalassium]ACF12688.1 protein of unknown function DUF92 transmembrane [Chloroherpeton thalassium ATCC 35110]